MATSTTTDYTSIPTPPSACVYAEMRYGSNGGAGDPELLIGNSGSDASTGRMVWDTDDSGFNTGEVSFTVTIPPTGGSANPDTLAVVDAVTFPISYTLKTYGKISAVIVIAGVQINASVAFTGLNVAFYKSGHLFETFNLASGPAVNTTTASNPVAAEVLTITPSTLLEGQVVITGFIEMQAPDGVYPGVDDLFGQIFIQTTTCT